MNRSRSIETLDAADSTRLVAVPALPQLIPYTPAPSTCRSMRDAPQRDHRTSLYGLRIAFCDDMAVHEIDRRRWDEFLDEFSQTHRAWRATVERVSKVGPRCIEVSNEPLRSVSTAVSGERITEIGIEFQGDERLVPSIHVQYPQCLRVDEVDGSIQSLEIADRNDVVTRIFFRVPSPPGILDGVAPGELS